MTPTSLSAPPLAPTSATPRPWRRRLLTSRSTRIPTPSSSTCGAEVRRHQGSGGGRQCAGDQRREEARGREGRRQVRENGEEGRQVYEEVCVAGRMRILIRSPRFVKMEY
ncbi:hypothetical protein CK203_003590 [Vitis vinifera]|uniref:Uncharacterized protein n=1 Tax=Vitis vinifera TaxID=29760 RepID=A0A438K885_VITVI|nr:hypothetical protein CK203_003590 [Vitis vinifera]